MSFSAGTTALCQRDNDDVLSSGLISSKTRSINQDSAEIFFSKSQSQKGGGVLIWDQEPVLIGKSLR